MLYYLIRNICAIATLIVVAYLSFVFISGIGINKKLEGEYKYVYTSDKYIFIDIKYFHNSNSGTYRIRGNKIIFIETGEKFLIKMHSDYIVIDGQYYLKQ